MKQRNNFIVLIFSVLVLIAPPAYSFLQPSAESTAGQTRACPSGRWSAKLTGWTLDGKMPVGQAIYDEAAQKLEITVNSVNLADGRKLEILIGDDRVGELEPLKSGSASGIITQKVEEGDLVRVVDDERPIVSRTLTCVAATPTPTASPTASPTPTPSPTAQPSVSPTDTPIGPPTATPTPSPTL